MRGTTAYLTILGVILLGTALYASATNIRSEPRPAPPAAFTAPTTDPAPEPVVETIPPAPSKAELAFLDAVDHETTVAAGREVCGLDDEYGEPPTLASIVENRLFEGDLYKAAIRHLCPKYLPLWRKAATAFDDGTYTVGEDLKPGTYRTARQVTDCYWERSTGGGQIIANNFVTFAPKGVTVTVRRGEGFTSNGCGIWVRA